MGLLMLGGCGPMLSGYLVTLVRSNDRLRIPSPFLFGLIFMVSLAVVWLRLSIVDGGRHNMNGVLPSLSGVGWKGWVVIGIACALLGLNASQAASKTLEGNYIHSFLFHRSKLFYYGVGLFLLPLLLLASYGMAKVFGLKSTDFVLKLDVVWVIGFFSTFFFLGGNEEFGWRGFLQKNLQHKYSPLLTALIISFFWSLWHLPLHYNGVYSKGGWQDLLPRFVWTIPYTLGFSWLYNRSGYSILAVVLLHSMLNNAPRGFGSSEQSALLLVMVFCIYCIVDGRMWKKIPPTVQALQS